MTKHQQEKLVPQKIECEEDASTETKSNMSYRTRDADRWNTLPSNSTVSFELDPEEHEGPLPPQIHVKLDPAKGSIRILGLGELRVTPESSNALSVSLK